MHGIRKVIRLSRPLTTVEAHHSIVFTATCIDPGVAKRDVLRQQG
jgi:hypothetical protein